MSNKEIYRKLCATHYVPVFLQHWWMDVVCDKWDVALATEKEKPTGAWPYGIESKLGINLMRNPLLTPYTGPYVLPKANESYRQQDSDERKTIATLLPQLPAAKMWHIELSPGLKQAGVFSNAGLTVQARQTFVLGLQLDEATLLQNMKGNLRRDIATAEKDIAINNAPENLALLYKFHKHTLSKKGKKQHYSFEALQRLYDACAAHNACALWVATKGDETLAMIWHVWDARNSYYFMSAQNPAAKKNTATAALLWHAIRHAKNMGHTSFDFEGSMDEGIEGFFRGFGGTRELYMVLRKNESALWKAKEMIRG